MISVEQLPEGVFEQFSTDDSPTRFVHCATGLEFKYVPGGEFLMGLSHSELMAAGQISSNFQANLDELRPIRHRRVEPMLMSATPVLNRHLKVRPEHWDPDSPAYFCRREAELFATEHAMRLPKEHEWEYCCRAGSASLFAFGDALPSDDELARWMSHDFADGRRPLANSFGVCGLFEPQWCDEIFRINLGDDAPILDGSHSIRGGGAYFWPWQDDEWVWSMSAMRSPASGLDDGLACLRLIFDL